MFEEELPKKSVTSLLPTPPVLDRFSIDELHEYDAWLTHEKERIASEIIKKKSAAQAAASFFKS